MPAGESPITTDLLQGIDEWRGDRSVFVGVGYWRNEWYRLQRAAAIGFVAVRRIRMPVESLADPGRAGPGQEEDKRTLHARDNDGIVLIAGYREIKIQ